MLPDSVLAALLQIVGWGRDVRALYSLGACDESCPQNAQGSLVHSLAVKRLGQFYGGVGVFLTRKEDKSLRVTFGPRAINTGYRTT